MPEQKSTLLNLADWIDERHRATAEVGAAGIDAMHLAIDCALPDRALELADQETVVPGDEDELLWVRCRALWEKSRWDEVCALAADLPTEEPPAPLRVRIRLRAAWTDLIRGRPEGEFLGAVNRLRPWVHRNGSLAHHADLAHLDAYRALTIDDDLPAAAERTRLSSSLYAHLGEPTSEIKCRILGVRILAIEGQLAAAAAEAQRCVERARESRHPLLLIQALNACGTVAWRQGDWKRADEAYRAAVRLAEEFDESRWKFSVLANQARLLACRGEPGPAASLLDRIGREFPHTTGPLFAILEEYRGQVALIQGEARVALGHFENCEQELVRSHIQSYERAEVLLRKGEALVALEEFEAAELCLNQGLERLSHYPQALERGHILHQRGLCRAQRARPREALADLDRAVVELRGVGDRWNLFRCLLDRATIGVASDEQRVADATEARVLASLLGNPGSTRAAEAELARAEARLHRGPEPVPASTGGMVAEGKAMKAVVAEARLVAASDHPVLLQGETGTGKEVFARFLHEHSARASGPFVPVNCAAIPEALFEREFFGHAKGAFTGAHRGGPGLVEEAEGGTLFLDEVGELPATLQPKLLRLLQDGGYRRVGETRARRVDLRIVSATNRPLADAVSDGSFRADLFYRLRGFELVLPPLRERAEDLIPLAWTFLARQAGAAEAAIDPAALRVMCAYAWPGNVRELESSIASAWVRARESGVIRAVHLPQAVQARDRRQVARRLDLSHAVRRTERQLILTALERSQFRRTDAAALLGIGRNTLYEKMRRLGIRPEPAARVAS